MVLYNLSLRGFAAQYCFCKTRSQMGLQVDSGACAGACAQIDSQVRGARACPKHSAES